MYKGKWFAYLIAVEAELHLVRSSYSTRADSRRQRMPVTAGDGTDSVTCCAVIGPYEDLSIPRRTCPVSKERRHPLLNPISLNVSGDCINGRCHRQCQAAT